MQYIGKLIKTLIVPPTLHKATKNVGTPSDITLADERRKPKNQASALIFDLVKTP